MSNVHVNPAISGEAIITRKSTAGAPTTGTWAVGNFAIDSDGVLYVCTAAGSPGTWNEVAPTPDPSVSPDDFTAVGDFLVGTGDGTYEAQTPAEVKATLAIHPNDLDTEDAQTSQFISYDGESYEPAHLPYPGCSLVSFNPQTAESTAGTLVLAIFPWKPSEIDARYVTIRWMALVRASGAGAEPLNLLISRVQLAGGAEGAGVDKTLAITSVVDGSAYYLVSGSFARSELSSSTRHLTLGLNRGGASGAVYCAAAAMWLSIA